MSLKEFLKKRLMEYFITVTCVTLAMAILGLSLEPAARFGYDAYFSPLIFGLVSLIPALVTYSRRELSLRQTIIRKALHFLLLEILLVAFGRWAGLLNNIDSTASFALTVLIVYLAVNLFSWQLDKKEATQINQTLKALQGRE